MKFAKGRTQSVQEPQHTASSGAASAALQQSPLMQQQAAQLLALRQGAQQLLQRKQLTDVSQQISLEEEEPLQGKFEPAAVSQRQAEESSNSNNTGMPDQLKSGIESLSGYAMDDVKVHYNSAKPAQMQAHAYAQGTDIHLAPGQEKHLPHEAWHVVQQKQGRVRATTQLKGEAINDNPGLEHEADVMGAKALQRASESQDTRPDPISKGGNDGQVNSTEITTMFFSSSVPSIQRVEEPTKQRKRVREKDDETGEASQLKQFQKNPDQRNSKVVQLAIKHESEAPPGTKILVVNTSSNDAGDIGRVIRQSNSKPNCMVVEFDNEKGVLYRVYFNEIDVIQTTDDVVHSTEKAQLKLMMDQAIVAASDAVDELNAVMSTDETWAHGKIITPADQLKKCLSDCKNLSAEETATYLYTTYFYGPLNKYLRSPEVKFESAVVQRLVDITHAFLQRAFNATPGAALLPKFRMELQAEWIDKVATKTGDALTFRAFTSTHPELKGVNAMWGDIESGTFGKVTKLALLVFQGTSKFLYPSTKYFPTEHEHILPPEMHTHISEKYQIHWHDWTVTVYHLTVVGSGDVKQIELDFDKDGNVYRKK
ncbi:eCIS core domain-containing protein [Rheinheimera nanhaiensis]|nr:DUF4157 domain-containing protein [Rheinheimera nanhaiensis]